MWDKDLSKFSEWYAWEAFRRIRWDARNPRCIFCRESTGKKDQRKGGNQFFYQCLVCGKGFTDLTGTPFHKSRLTMQQIMFLTALCMADVPKKRISEILGIARSTVIRHAEDIKTSDLCRRINSGLLTRGITAGRIISYLTPKKEEEPITCRVCESAKLKPDRDGKHLVCCECGAEMTLDGKKVTKAPKGLTHENYRGRVLTNALCPHGKASGCSICDTRQD